MSDGIVDGQSETTLGTQDIADEVGSGALAGQQGDFGNGGVGRDVDTTAPSETGLGGKDATEANEALAAAAERNEIRAEQLATEREELEAKEEAMAEAHANGEAFYWGETNYDGDTVQEWILPDGTTVYATSDGQAVGIEYPPGVSPEYVGDVVYEGEAVSVYELPGGTQILIDEDGDQVGTIDDFMATSTSVPLMYVTGDPNDAGAGHVDVLFVPTGPPDYDTEIVDAETGKVLGVSDTGGYHVGIYNDEPGTYSTYQPPGADYYLVLDEEGNVVGQEDVPPEKEWGILGVVEYYDDGTVTVGAFGSEVSVDVIGGEGGITIDIDAALVEVSAGLEWEEDGSWTFDSSVDVDTPTGDFGGEIEFGRDENGNGFLNVDTYVDMNVGLGHIEGGQHLHIQQTDDGFEASLGLEGTFSAFGVYLSHDQRLDVVKDGDDWTATYEDTIGAGIKGLGGLEVSSITQVHTDGTWAGSGATQGVHGAVVDEYGNAVEEGGAYVNTDGELYTQEDKLDNQFEYEVGPNQDDFPAEFDGGADFKFHDGEDPEGDEDTSEDSPAARLGLDREGVAGGRPGRGDDSDSAPRDVFDELPETRADFGSSAGGSPNIDSSERPTPDVYSKIEWTADDSEGPNPDGDAPDRNFATPAGGSPNIDSSERPTADVYSKIEWTADDSEGPNPDGDAPDRNFGTMAGGDPNVGSAPRETPDLDSGLTAGGDPNVDMATSATDRPGMTEQPDNDFLRFSGGDALAGDRTPTTGRPGMTEQPDGDDVFLEWQFSDAQAEDPTPTTGRSGMTDRPDGDDYLTITMTNATDDEEPTSATSRPGMADRRDGDELYGTLFGGDSDVHAQHTNRPGMTDQPDEARVEAAGNRPDGLVSTDAAQAPRDVFDQPGPRVSPDTIDPAPHVSPDTIDPAPHVSPDTIDPAPQVSPDTIDPAPQVSPDTADPAPPIPTDDTQPAPNFSTGPAGSPHVERAEPVQPAVAEVGQSAAAIADDVTSLPEAPGEAPQSIAAVETAIPATAAPAAPEPVAAVPAPAEPVAAAPVPEPAPVVEAPIEVPILDAVEIPEPPAPMPIAEPDPVDIVDEAPLDDVDS